MFHFSASRGSGVGPSMGSVPFPPLATMEASMLAATVAASGGPDLTADPLWLSQPGPSSKVPV